MNPFMQFRPSGGEPDAPFYSPQRDIAYVLASVVQAAPDFLTSEKLPSWLGEVLRGTGIGEPQLQDAVRKYLDALENFQDPDFDNPKDAIAAAGFWDLPDHCKVAVTSVVGLIVTSFYFQAIRQATLFPGARTPDIVLATGDAKEALAIGREVMAGKRR